VLAESRLRLEWRIVGALVAAQALLVALNGINTFTFHADFLIIEQEANLPTWFSSILFAFASLACVLAAWAEREWLGWGLPAAALAFFSLDEIAMLHEHFEDRTDEQLLVEVVEPLGVAAAVALAAYLVVRRLSGLARVLVIGAGVALVLAQVFSLANSAADLPYSISNIVSIGEEVWEMLMGTLLLAAAAPYALRALGSLQERYGPESPP
jgi:hypothetical protein